MDILAIIGIIAILWFLSKFFKKVEITINSFLEASSNSRLRKKVDIKNIREKIVAKKERDTEEYWKNVQKEISEITEGKSRQPPPDKSGGL